MNFRKFTTAQAIGTFIDLVIVTGVTLAFFWKDIWKGLNPSCQFCSHKEPLNPHGVCACCVEHHGNHAAPEHGFCRCNRCIEVVRNLWKQTPSNRCVGK